MNPTENGLEIFWAENKWKSQATCLFGKRALGPGTRTRNIQLFWLGKVTAVDHYHSPEKQTRKKME